jgi:peptidoglycan-N-acetylglucosamine deacetylase
MTWSNSRLASPPRKAEGISARRAAGEGGHGPERVEERAHRATLSSLPAAALSVDVEDYFQVWAFEDLIRREDWAKWPARVGENARRLLDIFDETESKATFFVLGYVAASDPALVRAIAARGHEVASHGWEHVPVDHQTPDAFRRDVARTRALLEDLVGAPVLGYRAANFSIGPSTPWAYEVLAETGYRYSSSVNPIAHDHYGDPTAPRIPHAPHPGDSGFREIPVATFAIGRRRIPCGGGGWFRAVPYVPFRFALRQAAKLGSPPVFYIHPWEIDPGQPRMAGARRLSRWRHYINVAATETKLGRLLQDFRWGRIDRLCLENAASRPSPVCAGAARAVSDPEVAGEIEAHAWTEMGGGT